MDRFDELGKRFDEYGRQWDRLQDARVGDHIKHERIVIDVAEVLERLRKMAPVSVEIAPPPTGAIIDLAEDHYTIT